MGCRSRALDAVEELYGMIVERVKTHAQPDEEFRVMRELWGGILEVEVKPEQVIAMLIAMKLARALAKPDVRDHWMDIAGYGVLGAAYMEDIYGCGSVGGGQEG